MADILPEPRPPKPARKAAKKKAPKPRKPAKQGGSLTRRAARIATVMGRHGVRDIFTSGGLEGDETTQRENAAAFRDALQELGPTFSKLGQILSTRSDLLPPAFIEELESLQERVTPLTEEEVVGAIEKALGVPWEDAFESIDPNPLAAGTIAQVHKAVLEDGERVVVKVQRPNAEGEILQDLELLKLFAEQTADRETFRRMVDVPAIVEHLAGSLERELDFHGEAANIERMRKVVERFDRVAVPRVYDAFTSKTLLVLEEIQGVPLKAAPDTKERREAARQLLEAYYHQILTEGFFHADPHPGNMRWGDDGRIYLFDLGMVGELETPVREALLLLVMALWQEDAPFLAEAILALSEHDGVDVESFAADVELVMRRFQGESIKDIEFGPLLQEVTTISLKHGVRLPASLALTGKALAQMQLAVGELDPDLEPFQVAGRYLMRHFVGRLQGKASPGKMLYEVSKLQTRLGRMFTSLEGLFGSARGGRLQVQFRGAEGLEETIRRAGRRLALSLGATATITAGAILSTTTRAPEWTAIATGSAGGLLLLALVWDLIRRR